MLRSINTIMLSSRLTPMIDIDMHRTSLHLSSYVSAGATALYKRLARSNCPDVPIIIMNSMAMVLIIVSNIL